MWTKETSGSPAWTGEAQGHPVIPFDTFGKQGGIYGITAVGTSGLLVEDNVWGISDTTPSGSFIEQDGIYGIQFEDDDYWFPRTPGAPSWVRES